MISIKTDIPVQFDPIDPFFDLLHRDTSEEALFREIRKYLAKYDIKGGYSLGKVGDHEEISLFQHDGYWIIAYSERGNNKFLGLFRSYYDATNFFVWTMTKKSPEEMINWKAVFE